MTKKGNIYFYDLANHQSVQKCRQTYRYGYIERGYYTHTLPTHPSPHTYPLPTHTHPRHTHTHIRPVFSLNIS